MPWVHSTSGHVGWRRCSLIPVQCYLRIWVPDSTDEEGDEVPSCLQLDGGALCLPQLPWPHKWFRTLRSSTFTSHVSSHVPPSDTHLKYLAQTDVSHPGSEDMSLHLSLWNSLCTCHRWTGQELSKGVLKDEPYLNTLTQWPQRLHLYDCIRMRFAQNLLWEK